MHEGFHPMREGFYLIDEGQNLIHEVSTLVRQGFTLVHEVQTFVDEGSNLVDGVQTLAHEGQSLVDEVSTLVNEGKTFACEVKTLVDEVSTFVEGFWSVSEGWFERAHYPLARGLRSHAPPFRGSARVSAAQQIDAFHREARRGYRYLKIWPKERGQSPQEAAHEGRSPRASGNMEEREKGMQGYWL